MVSKRKTMAIKTPADFTTRTNMGTITIAEGGVLVAVAVKPVDFVLTTTQTAGGLVELENDAVDWKPFEFPTHGVVELTATSGGGAEVENFVMLCHKKLPSNSTVTVYYTAKDAGNQSLAVTLFWETGMSYKGKQTYSKADVGTEVTSATKDSDHNTVNIPAEKGGTVISFLAKVHGTLEAGVESGGKVEVKNDAEHWEPCEFYTHGATCVVSGAVQVKVQIIPMNLVCPPRSKVDTDYTPYDDQSQAVTFAVVWEG